MILTRIDTATSAVKMVTTNQNDFFDPKTLESLGGSSIAVLLVCNAAQNIFNFNPKWLALVISIIISYTIALTTNGEHDAIKYLIAFFNGLLIWSTAVGGNTLSSGRGQTAADKANFTSQVGTKRTFFQKW